jgi:hypothetical protein
MIKRGIEKSFLLLVVLLLFLSGCNNAEPSSNKSFESMEYEISECSEDKEEIMEINTEERLIKIKHIIEVNCCFDAELSYKKTDGILRIYEDFYGEECDCNCKREINADIDGKGINEIEFYSRKDKDYPYELLLDKER